MIKYNVCNYKKKNMRFASIFIRLLCFIETNNNCNMVRDIFLFHYWLLIFNIHIPIHYPEWPSFYWKKPPLNTDCVFFIQRAHSNRFASLPWIIHLIMQSKSRLVYSKTSPIFLRPKQCRIIWKNYKRYEFKSSRSTISNLVFY